MTTKIAMVSLAGHVYAGRRLKPGTEFEARGAQDARLLIALKRADFAPALQEDEPQYQQAIQEQPAEPAVSEFLAPTPAAAPPEPQDQPEPSEPSNDEPGDDGDSHPGDEPPADADAEISPRTGKPKRKYLRRDMTAEGSEG